MIFTIRLTRIIYLFGFITVLTFLSCERDITEEAKYKRPDWLRGKINELIVSEPDLATFSRLLEITGYDSLINNASYTVFAPTDEAFNQFFQENPEYQQAFNSGDTSAMLNDLTENLILYNAWNRDQFNLLDFLGWIDPNDPSDQPRAFKRLTLMREPNKTYFVKAEDGITKIVNPGESSRKRLAFTQSNKFVPIFYQDFLNIYQLSGSDYQYYFDRSFSPENVYYAGAMFDSAIPAENGFIYKIDKVVEPLPNAETLLEEGHEGQTYNQFTDLIHEFSEFTFNREATFDQPGADQGLAVDSLFDLNYPGLVFNIRDELVTDPNYPSSFTYVLHNGLYAPTDNAFNDFVDEYIADGWGNIEALPLDIKRILVNAHMSYLAFYPSQNFASGFLNGNGDIINLSEGDIIQKSYGSNSTFLGLNKVLVPRVFQSIAQPIYLTKLYTIALGAVEDTRVVEALKTPGVGYSLFLPTDLSIGFGGDSSLIVDEYVTPAFSFRIYEAFDRTLGGWSPVSTDDLRKKLLNQIGSELPTGAASKEFIKNLGDNYIVIDNVNNTVRGTAQTRVGYNGVEDTTLTINELPGNFDNGKVYDVATWFNFSQSDFYSVLLNYSEFHRLLNKAGLFDNNLFVYKFISEGEFYTVFAPTNAAIANSNLDDLSIPELQKVLKYHFVKGGPVFTDGKAAQGEYLTERIDETSTDLNKVYSTINIRPGLDKIDILTNSGSVYATVVEAGSSTNRFVSFDTNENNDSRWDFITTGVVHSIDKVILKDSIYSE